MDNHRQTPYLMLSCYLISLMISQAFSAPAQQSHNSPITSSGSMLHSVIEELENALYKLKLLTNTLQLPTGKDAAMLGDAEPEFDLSDLERVAAQHSAATRPKPDQQSAAVRPRPKSADAAVDQSQSIVEDLEGDNMPLEEALQYLLALAKERKLKRRDHDIPFPVSGKD